MGVFKLWQLLLTIAQPYSIDRLSGKVLAIDASIWIVKIDTSFNSNAQKIKSILNKIMLLRRNNILPVFVFDGVPPALKRRTLEERYRKRLVADDLQTKKRSQIEMMRIIEGTHTSRNMERNKRISQNEGELGIINEQLRKLAQYPKAQGQEEVSQQILEKIALQSQILNTKYHLMLDLVPQYRQYPYFIDPEDYKDLQLQLKIQYLDQLEQYKWKHLKKVRKIQKIKNMTQQDKIMHDLEIIQKKSIIREMQDNLFRKMMQKNVKIQNGFEIIETIYNGKPVVQKRKIKDKNTNNYGIGGFRKDKMKNNMANINFGQEKGSDSEIDVDPFIASLCNHSVTSNSQNGSQVTSSNSQTLKGTRTFKYVKKNENKPKKNKIRQSSDQNQEESAQPYIPFHSERNKRQQQPQSFVNRQELNQRYAHSQQETMNRDNLPNFNSDQNPNYINKSNDNIQLQNLFTILGLPFLIAPGQAQAQCAALEREGIVDGVITEDSDVFLFGAKNVYRGVFNNNIRYYSFNRMQQKLKLTREKLIIFAELLGSDYSQGVKGIGLVNAMEILKVFDTFDKMNKFKQWAEHPDLFLPQEQTTNELMKLATKEQKQFYELHKKFKNYWIINPTFGNAIIHNAYLRPDVVKEQQIIKMKEQGTFKDKVVKLQLLNRLLKERLELEDREYDHYFKLLNMRFDDKRANTILNYFRPKDNDEEIQLAKIKSKRLQKSLNQIDRPHRDSNA